MRGDDEMLSKFKINLIFLLCMLSLVSIGFSSWSITLDAINVDANISVDNVVNSEDYIYLDTTKGDNNTGISCFKYKNNGYLDNNGEISNTGYINAYFIIDLNKCKLLFSKSNSIYLSITLKYANDNPTILNIFEDDRQELGYRTINHEVIIDNNYDVTIGSISGIDNKQYILPITINDILTIEEQFISFQIKYSFFATAGNYFNEQIYKYLYGDNIKFSITVLITNSN